MSPTIMKIGAYRFFFNSNEEERMHVHIQTPDGVAKFWLEPIVAHAASYRLDQRTLKELSKLVEENAHVFTDAWRKYFNK
jgi:hypothetical protein